MMPSTKRPSDAAVIPSLKTRRRLLTDTADDDPFFEQGSSAGDDASVSEIEETAEEKKLKIAKEYLARMKAEAEDNDSDVDETIRRKLKEQYEDEARNKEIANRIVLPETIPQKPNWDLECEVSRWDPTSVRVTADGRSIYVVDKNGGITLFDTETGNKTKIPLERDFYKLAEADGRRAPWISTTGSYGIARRALVASALTDDGQFLAVGGGDKHIHIFDLTSQTCIQSLSGHREAVSGLVFQSGTRELYSCSYDRTVKRWSVGDSGYVDTLFGHQSEVFDIDMTDLKRAVTSGNDRSCRLWKLSSDSQLVFRAPTLSVDCCRMFNGSNFVSGSANGIQLWHVAKKKPITTVSVPWVHSIATVHRSDLMVSGSDDGCIRVWGAVKEDGGERLRDIRRLGAGLHAEGYITTLDLSRDGRLVVGGMSRRPRLGNWTTLSSPVSNGIVLHRFIENR